MKLDCFKSRQALKAMTFWLSVSLIGASTALSHARAGCLTERTRLWVTKLRAPFAPSKNVIVVDGYSSGNQFAQEISKRGFTPIHLQSNSEIGEALTHSFRPEDYKLGFLNTGDEAVLMKQLRALRPAAIIAGSDPGVELADRLRDGLHLAGNDLKLSAARRDKFLMHDRLREAGVAYARSLHTSSLADGLHWIESELKGSWPVVIKPLSGAGTQNVVICGGPKEVEKAFRDIMDSTAVTGAKNTEVLFQEFLKGTEYVVDSVSLHGKPVFSDLWRYNKIRIPRADGGIAQIYDFDELLPFQGETQARLMAYGKQVLDALGVKEGPAHMEVMMTERGPVLVEINPRVIGSGIPKYLKIATGTSPVEMTVDAALEPGKFKKAYLGSADPVPVNKYIRIVELNSPHAGTVANVSGLKEIEKLPSFYLSDVHLHEGEKVEKTVDMLTGLGRIILMNEDPEALARDYRAIRAMEQSSKKPIEIEKVADTFW